MRNVESKFRCGDHERILREAVAAGAIDRGLVSQRDVFFSVPQGRLKLRHLEPGERGELIAYKRDNLAMARPSEYGLYTTDSLAALEAVLGRALPPGGTVVKLRHLLTLDHTRIHLDEVVGLGRFVELETVIGGISDDQAQREHEEVGVKLGLQSSERVAVGYIDL